MFILKIPFGKIGITLSSGQRSRLSGTCFRGKHVCKAGNFCRWSSFEAMLNDRLFMDVLRGILNDMLMEHGQPVSKFREHFSIPFTEPVGWSSTLPCELVDGRPNERRPLNKQSEAVFLIDPSFPAPLTRIVTLTTFIKADIRKALDAIVFVDTLYPGPTIGRLIGDMTKATGHWWFDFQHPGGDKLVELDF